MGDKIKRVGVGDPTAPMNSITPRQSLMMALSDVDDYDCVVIVMGKRNPLGGVQTQVNTAALNIYEALGLLAQAQLTIRDL